MRSFCRCVVKFNTIHKYPLFVVFLWNFSTIISSLVSLQFQLVEYKYAIIINRSCKRSNANIANYFTFKVGWKFEFNRIGCYINSNTMGFWIYFWCLWAWRSSDEPIWNIWKRIWQLRLVCITDWIAANLLDSLGGYTTTDNASKLLRHCVYTGHIQNGINSIYNTSVIYKLHYCL